MTSSNPGHPVFLDRLEGRLAVLVLEDRELKIPSEMLPPGVHEGDCLKLSLSLDLEATRESQERIARKRAARTAGDGGGNLVL